MAVTRESEIFLSHHGTKTYVRISKNTYDRCESHDCFSYWSIRVSVFSPSTQEISVDESPAPVPYYVLTEHDAGTTTPVKIGGTVIVQLPGSLYGEPVAATDADQRTIPTTIETYNDSFIVSFSVPTTTAMNLSIHHLKDTPDFRATFIASSSSTK